MTLFLFNNFSYKIYIYYKFFSIKINYHFINIFLYYKIYIINRIINQILGHSNIIKDSYINYNYNNLNINLYININLYTNFCIYMDPNLYMKINNSLITLSLY